MWNEMYKKYWWYPNEKKIFLIDFYQLKMLSKILSQESKVLDLWCWKWYLWRYLSKIVWDYLWIDISLEALKIAGEINKKWKFLNIDYRNFNYYNNFNIIIDNWLFHILDNLGDYFLMLEKISKGTYYSIRVFNSDFNNKKIYNIDCWDFLINIYWYTFNFVLKKFIGLNFKLIDFRKWINYDDKNTVNYYLFIKE